MKRTRLLAAALAMLLLSGCGGAAKSESAAAPEASAPSGSVSMDAAVESPKEVPMAPEYSLTVNGGEGESIYERADANLIRRCTVGLQTVEVEAAVSALYDLVEAQGGFFENSSVRGG